MMMNWTRSTPVDAAPGQQGWRLWALLLAALTLTFTAACGGSDDGDGEVDTSNGTTDGTDCSQPVLSVILEEPSTVEGFAPLSVTFNGQVSTLQPVTYRRWLSGARLDGRGDEVLPGCGVDELQRACVRHELGPLNEAGLHRDPVRAVPSVDVQHHTVDVVIGDRAPILLLTQREAHHVLEL